MTIGEKIKYVRKLYRMSSNELAIESGIHPVTIRKYESNHMIPSSAQIERIASAFHLSAAVFHGLTEIAFDYRYPGDCLATLILLYTSSVLILEGDLEEGGRLKKDTIRFSFSALFSNFIGFSLKDTALPADEINLLLKDPDTLEQFIFWEFMYNRRDELHAAWMEEQTPNSQAAYREICDEYEKAEMNTVLLGKIPSR